MKSIQNGTKSFLLEEPTRVLRQRLGYDEHPVRVGLQPKALLPLELVQALADGKVDGNLDFF